MYRDASRDWRAGRRVLTYCGSRGQATASTSSSSVGGVASSVVLPDRDSCVSHSGEMSLLF
jgi:hypothetical protein